MRNVIPYRFSHFRLTLLTMEQVGVRLERAISGLFACLFSTSIKSANLLLLLSKHPPTHIHTLTLTHPYSKINKHFQLNP